jgi:phosphopantothenoylcysteine decarboxylase/phosphopantothenate--cysteine ligase
MKGKKIILGVTGSIAAYKSAELIRLLVKAEAEVKVVMTPSAAEFITPLALSVLSCNPVCITFSKPETGEWTNHVELGLWGDLMVVAPASANTIGKFAHGLCDNLLTAVYLSCRCPVMIAPAMDVDMYHQKAVKKNIATLESFGHILIGPAKGELASGLTGEGRMEEPEVIFNKVYDFFSKKKELSGKKILVSAGPTREAIDPVRFISNHSSGKMGYSIAVEFANRGAEVTLVSGPVNISVSHPMIKIKPVESAGEMYRACMKEFQNCDMAVMTAAVADFTPEHASTSKKKKNGSDLQLKLKPTPDILAEMGKKKKKQVLVGFALETNNGIENAMKKLLSKNLDYVVLNSLNEKNKVFNSDFNKVSILAPGKKAVQYASKPKQQVAADIVEYILSPK